MRNISDKEIERAIELRERGKSIQQIARILQCHSSTVNWHLTKHGIVSPRHGGKLLGDRGPLVVKRGDHVVKRFSSDEDELIRAMRIAGSSYNAIARATGRRVSSIIGRLNTLARRDEHAERSP